MVTRSSRLPDRQASRRTERDIHLTRARPPLPALTPADFSTIRHRRPTGPMRPPPRHRTPLSVNLLAPRRRAVRRRAPCLYAIESHPQLNRPSSSAVGHLPLASTVHRLHSSSARVDVPSGRHPSENTRHAFMLSRYTPAGQRQLSRRHPLSDSLLHPAPQSRRASAGLTLMPMSISGPMVASASAAAASCARADHRHVARVDLVGALRQARRGRAQGRRRATQPYLVKAKWRQHQTATIGSHENANEPGHREVQVRN